MVAPLKEKPGIEFTDESLGLLSRGSLKAVAVGEAIEHLGLKGQRTPVEQRRYRRKGHGGGWSELARAGEPWGRSGFKYWRRQGWGLVGFDRLREYWSGGV